MNHSLTEASFVIVANQKHSFRKNSNTIRKTLSSCALNGWDEPNLGYSMYKDVCAQLWETSCIFILILELFHFKFNNLQYLAHKCHFQNMQIAHWCYVYTQRALEVFVGTENPFIVWGTTNVGLHPLQIKLDNGLAFTHWLQSVRLVKMAAGRFTADGNWVC